MSQRDVVVLGVARSAVGTFGAALLVTVAYGVILNAVALRETRLAIMDRATFLWLFENSVAFNRFLVAQLNERVGHFMGLLEYGRMLDATGRVARCIASLFNPILYPDKTRHLEITQEEVGALSGMSRQNANQCLKRLEKEGMLRLDYGGLTILDLEGLRHYGE